MDFSPTALIQSEPNESDRRMTEMPATSHDVRVSMLASKVGPGRVAAKRRTVARVRPRWNTGREGCDASARKPRFEPRIERIVAREHMVQIGDRNRLGAFLAQETCEGVHFCGRAMQRHYTG